MDRHKFSIIIPLYNKEKHIKRCLASVLNQIYLDFEIIIVNDGSTDKSVSKIYELECDKIIVYDQSNKGVSSARNNGINIARYPWIIFLDADDEMQPNYLLSMSNMINSYPDQQVFATGYEFEYSDGRVESPKFYGVPEKGTFGILPNYFESTIKGKTVMTGSSVCIHQDVFNTVGFFPEGFKRGEDLDMWFRIALHYKIVFYNSPLIIYHKDVENSATTFIDDVRNTFPYHHWLKAPKNKFNLPYQKRYVINRIAKAIYILAQHRKLRYLFRFFMR